MVKSNDTAPDEPTKPLPRASGAAGQPAVAATEQIPTTPKPVSASSAASRGASGLADATAGPAGTRGPRSSVFRRHPIATGITAGAVAVILASGLTAWGVDSALTSTTGSQATPLAPTSTTSPGATTGDQGGRLDPARAMFRATIESIAGQSSGSGGNASGGNATWTILTRRGQTVTVQVTSDTQFGTKKKSETPNDFEVGDTVIIVATRADGTATAIRIVSAPGGNAPIPTPSPTSTAST
jgi:hypothetical protein